MSGICGFVAFGGRLADPGVVDAMARAAGHRGPDGIQIRCEAGAGLAHLALHVTPEDVHDPQPVQSGDVWLVADARIDNLAELAQKLKADLTGFHHTSTAILQAAYRRWGPRCPEHLVGDFAFVVWDARLKQLFAARDPSGVRSLYYRIEHRRILFGTEVKQILAAPDVPRSLHEAAVAGHLAGGYGRPEWSFYEGIAQLPPGHALEATEEGHRVRRFWDPTPATSVRYRRQGEYVEHFRHLFEQAVLCRVRGARPAGILLSGGMDSGSVASVAGQLRRTGRQAVPELRSYSFAFSELKDSDEREVSRAIVAAFHLAATDVPGDDAWPLSGFPQQGPDADSPFHWTYHRLLERCADRARSDGVGVLLTGEGGDELLGDRIFDLAGLAASLRLPSLVTETRALAMQLGTDPWTIARREVIRPIRRSLARLPGFEPFGPRPASPAARQGRPWVNADLAHRTGIEGLIKDDPRHDWHRMTPLERRGLRLSSPHLPRLLAWHENLHARAGLGAAMPLTDQRLVRYVLSVPPWIVNSPSEPKRLVRRAVRGIMPEAARRGARKLVPTSLYERGMRERGVDVLRDLLEAREMTHRGFVDPDALRAQGEAFLRGETSAYDVWWAVTLEWWLRLHWRDA